jgi:hypothetical protein
MAAFVFIHGAIHGAEDVAFEHDHAQDLFRVPWQNGWLAGR